MKKINLKSILKKTFKKKKKAVLKKKTKPTTKKPKAVKIKNKIGRPKIKQTNKNSLKEKAKLSSSKPKNAENLRLTKVQDQKPEIIKIKKQETEKKQFKVKDYIVYPKHGVGQILSVSSKTIGGIDVQCYDIKFEKDKAIGLLPINKQSNLRPLSTINQVNKSISILKGKPKIKRSMWSRRAQEVLGLYLKRNLKFRTTILCTGGAISFFTGDQAPINSFIDNFYLGWLVRLVFNPIIFFKRYLSGLKLIPMVFFDKIQVLDS